MVCRKICEPKGIQERPKECFCEHNECMYIRCVSMTVLYCVPVPDLSLTLSCHDGVSSHLLNHQVTTEDSCTPMMSMLAKTEVVNG